MSDEKVIKFPARPRYDFVRQISEPTSDHTNEPVDTPEDAGTNPADMDTSKPEPSNGDAVPEGANAADEDADDSADAPSAPTQAQLQQLMEQARQMVQFMKSAWDADMREYKVDANQMRELWQFNEQHKKEPPEKPAADFAEDQSEDTPEDKAEPWDDYNGLDDLTDEEVERIFGKDHPIIGVEMSQTLDRLKSVAADYFNWNDALREYTMIHNAYMELVEDEEEKAIGVLRDKMEAETDPEKVAKMQESLQRYENVSYLDFLADPLVEEERQRYIRYYTDSAKLEYLIHRGKDKLKQLKVSEKVIDELLLFEIRNLPDKYYKCRGLLLIYYLMMIVHMDCYNRKDIRYSYATAFLIRMDRYVRRAMSEPRRERITRNILAFLDQLIDDIPDAPKEGE